MNTNDHLPHAQIRNPNFKWKNYHNKYIPGRWRQALYFIVNDIYATESKKFRNGITNENKCSMCNVEDTLTHKMCFCGSSFAVWEWTRNVFINRLKVPPDKCYPFAILSSEEINDVSKHNATLWFLSGMLYFNMEERGPADQFENMLRSQRLYQCNFYNNTPYGKYIFVY